MFKAVLCENKAFISNRGISF